MGNEEQNKDMVVDNTSANETTNVNEVPVDTSTVNTSVSEATNVNASIEVPTFNASVDETTNADGLPEEVAADNSSKKKKGKKKVIILIIVIFIIIGLLCVGALLFMNNKKTKVKTDKVSTNSKYRMKGNGLSKFDLYFLQLENEEQNKIYSPLSIKYALAMLQEGANGNTKQQITDLIGDYKSKKYLNSDHMSLANAMFIRNTYNDKVNETYKKTLSDKYNAEVILDELSSPDSINNWVSNKTFNLVNNLVDDVNGNDFFLVNALAIDMNWKNQIHCASGSSVPCINNGEYHIEYSHEKLDDDSGDNYKKTDYAYDNEDYFYGHYNNGEYVYNKFNGKDGVKASEVLADFNKYDIVKDLGEDKIKEIIKPEYEEWLKTEDGKNDPPFDQFIGNFIQELKDNYGEKANSTDFSVHEDDSVKVFAKDLQEYDGTTLQYVGIMPKNDSLKDFVDNTDENKINKIIKSLKEVNIDSFEEGYVTRIRGMIPLFKYEYQLKLVDDLKKIGVTDVFDSKKSDLSNISKDGATIGKAVHKANIEFSNDGIKAGAATTMAGYGAATGPHFEHLFKVPVKDIDVTFDKPYMYLIRDKATGEVWFTGTVYEPIMK